MEQAFGNRAPSKAAYNYKEWFRRFKNRDFDFHERLP